jgi:tol-pal system protein YbgF
VLTGSAPRKFASRAEGPVKEKPELPTENLGVAPVPPIAKAPPVKPAAVDPVKMYKDAYELLKAGKHDEAARGFRELVQRAPDHDLADNAQYWLGECFYARKLYLEAMPEFRLVTSRYPLGNKAPDALLKLGYCLLALGDAQKGREILKQVPETYPNTEAARLAQVRLTELRSAGGTE